MWTAVRDHVGIRWWQSKLTEYFWAKQLYAGGSKQLDSLKCKKYCDSVSMFEFDIKEPYSLFQFFFHRDARLNRVPDHIRLRDGRTRKTSRTLPIEIKCSAIQAFYIMPPWQYPSFWKSGWGGKNVGNPPVKPIPSKVHCHETGVKLINNIDCSRDQIHWIRRSFNSRVDETRFPPDKNPIPRRSHSKPRSMNICSWLCTGRYTDSTLSDSLSSPHCTRPSSKFFEIFLEFFWQRVGECIKDENGGTGESSCLINPIPSVQ